MSTGSIQILELVLIGLCAGFLGGLLGIGGSIIMIPALTEVLGPDQHLYQSAAMIVNFCVVVPALVQHRRAKAIHHQVVLRTVPVALVAVLLGVALSELPLFSGAGQAHLIGLFGFFLWCEGSYDLYRMFRAADPARDALALTDAGIERRATWRSCALVGGPTGIIGGLFGIGGGTISVPLQRRILHMPIRSAIANSAAIMLFTSLPGAVMKNVAYAEEHGSVGRPLLLAAVLAPTAILGSFHGSRLTHRLPVRTVKIAFFAVLCVVALRLMYRAYAMLG